MAIQAIHNRASVALPGERDDRWERVKDFFGGIADVLGLYFNQEAPIEVLDEGHRAMLSARDRADVDVAMLGIRRQ